MIFLSNPFSVFFPRCVGAEIDRYFYPSPGRRGGAVGNPEAQDGTGKAIRCDSDYEQSKIPSVLNYHQFLHNFDFEGTKHILFLRQVDQRIFTISSARRMPLSSRLQVRVHTGDKKGAGSDAKIRIKLRDSAGKETPLFKLNNLLVNDHERDSVSEFQLPKNYAASLADLDSIILLRNTSGKGHSWFVDLVEVLEQPQGTTWLFPVHRWLHGYTEYRLRQYDLSLPQQDDADMKARRQKELGEKREMYQYMQHIKDGPVQVG